MTTLADAHAQWHQIHGKYAVCDLDCGAGEYIGQFFEDDAEDVLAGVGSIKCGSCKGRHASVAAVKLCYEVKRDFDSHQLVDA